MYYLSLSSLPSGSLEGERKGNFSVKTPFPFLVCLSVKHMGLQLENCNTNPLFLLDNFEIPHKHYYILS